MKQEGTGTSLTKKMLLSLALGIGVGLFFGEKAAGLGRVGDAYVGLLQMTVLPFIAVSLVANIGRFSIAEGKDLARASVKVLLILWTLAMLAVAVVPLAFPDFDTGSFFSTSLVEAPVEIDFVTLYIPSNPIRAMAENMVPAVVLFSLLLGVALATVERKRIVLDQLDVLIQGLVKVNGFAVSLAPYGVFAIAAHAAGTITLNEFGRLQTYLVTHTLTVLLLSFVVLPMLVAALTPFGYRSIVGASKDFLLTAFITGSLFAVLPMIVAATENLVERQHLEQRNPHANPGVLVPLAYPFPTLGKLLSLIFVPFAAWFIGTPLAASAYPQFLFTGLVSSFGSLVLTIPFLLDLLRIPADLFQLFLMAGVWAARVSDLAGGMHILAFAVLVIAMLSGRLEVRWPQIVRVLLVTFGLGGLMIFGLNTGFGRIIGSTYSKGAVLASMQSLETDVPSRVLLQASANPIPLEVGQSRLDRARQRGAIRIGYSAHRLPFAYFNGADELVGFDVDMAYRLAGELDVGVEFVPFEQATLGAQLDADHFDLAMSGVRMTLALAEQATVSDPYLEVRWALVVADHRKDEFEAWDRVLKAPNVRWAVQSDSFHERKLRELVAGAEVTGLEREEEFFTAGEARYDVLVTSAEGGSAWTLVHPEFTVVTPIQPAPRAPLVYPLAPDDEVLEAFVNTWISVVSRNGTVDDLFGYWIQGKRVKGAAPRWSILRNVLQSSRRSVGVDSRE